jgi:hypothetical protein
MFFKESTTYLYYSCFANKGAVQPPGYRSTRTKTRGRLIKMLGVVLALTATVGTCITSPRVAVAQHSDNEMTGEHDAMLALVPAHEATHRAVVNNGSWSSPSTWNSGTIPGNGAKVHIPSSFTVTYDVNGAANVRWLRINGKLAFARTLTTALNVDTIIVDAGGEWEQGTPGNPIASNVSSTVTFTDSGAIDTTNYDTYFMSRGLLSHGKVRMSGATTTPFLKTNSALAAGATSLTLNAVPTNWKNGDTLVVSGMKLKLIYNSAESRHEYVTTDERKSISSISGSS